MIIKRNIQIEDFILKSIQDKLFNNQRTGLHLSDLLSPKQAYWQKVKPIPPSKKEIIYWLSGKAHESVFLHVSNFQRVKSKEWNGIWYSPDASLNVILTDKETYNDLLIEMKTSRRGFLVRDGEEADRYKHYLKQLGFYCAIENRTDSGLFVWYLTMMDENKKNTDPDFFFYDVEFTLEELETMRQEMLVMKDKFILALSENNPSELPDCEEWMCYKEKRNMIDKPYCNTCKKEFATDWGIDKHINSKTGKGHDIKKAVYEKVREPRCKYAIYCKPEMYAAYQEWYNKNRYVSLELEEENGNDS
jgi:hypothetical protein